MVYWNWRNMVLQQERDKDGYKSKCKGNIKADIKVSVEISIKTDIYNEGIIMDIAGIPVGTSDFAEIRQEKFYYIDKTALIEELLK